MMPFSTLEGSTYRAQTACLEKTVMPVVKEAKGLMTLAFLVSAISTKGPGLTVGHHIGPQVAAVAPMVRPSMPEARPVRATRDLGMKGRAIGFKHRGHNV